MAVAPRAAPATADGVERMGMGNLVGAALPVPPIEAEALAWRVTVAVAVAARLALCL